MLIRREGTEVTVIKYQVPRIVGVIEPTCVELGQLSQQFLRCLIRVTRTPGIVKCNKSLKLDEFGLV